MIDRGAIFDPTECYRYRLWRTWDAAAPRLVFVMLNPSTADAEVNDPTIRRCIDFAKTWEYGHVEIVNLFAYRTPHPNYLKTVADPVGIDNDRHLQQAQAQADQVVVAWGNHGNWLGRDRQVLSLLNPPLYCLGITKMGQPRHPLYCKRTSQVIRLSLLNNQ